VLLDAAPSAAREASWSLFDDAGRAVERGRGAPDRWPAAARREAVLAASRVRVVALALPPMPASRVAAAAAFALEDRLAATGDAAAIGVSAPAADGRVLASVASRATIDAIGAVTPRFARAVAEPALVPPGSPTRWTWYASAGAGGFVRTGDGGAFAVERAPSAAGPLPPELAASLTQALQSGSAPTEVGVAERCDDEALAAWRRETGIAFVRAEPWRWDAASSDAFAAAPDLLGRVAAEGSAPRVGPWRALRPAVVVAAAALALHVVATLAQWSWLRYDAWRTGREIVALARGAGGGAVVPEDATPDAAVAALYARDAALRHRAAAHAATDALPLLARAAPALAALPPAALKTAIYASGAWTFELDTQDDAAQAALDRRLRDAGLAPLSARTTAGHRVRVTLAP